MASSYKVFKEKKTQQEIIVTLFDSWIGFQTIKLEIKPKSYIYKEGMQIIQVQIQPES